jgi:phosphatidylglycerol:prolipoprotein diacylglycerol transferase
MFPSLAGVPTYVIFQTASVVAFLLLASWHLGGAATAGKRHSANHRPVHALGLTGVYVLCNFVAAKVFFDLRNDPGGLDWLNYLRPQHYFDGGFWGWPAAFFPLALLYPLVLRSDRGAIYRAVSLTLPPVLVLQKTACLAIGCCVGGPTDLPWGLSFPLGSQCPMPGVPVHPVPLYDVAISLAIYGVLLLLDRRDAARPFLFPALLAMYGLNRFATEFFRHEYAGMSLRQVLALAAAAGAVVAVVLFPNVWRRVAGAAPSSSAAARGC